MLETCANCPSCIQKFLQKLSSLLFKVKSWKRKKRPSPSSDFSWLNSSFAAMELSNQLKQVFNFIDTNGDGKISPLELSQVLFRLGGDRTAAAKEAEGMVREMDRDGDGFVDLEEFLIIVMKGAENSQDSSSSSSSSSCSDGVNDDEDDEELRKAFMVFDEDKNGLISAKELHKVLSSLLVGCDRCSLRHCRRMIRGVDKDGDGFVDFQEFKAMMTTTTAAAAAASASASAAP